MEDTASKENPPADFNKIDLSQLQGFSFGTQWTQDKSGASDKRGPGEARERRGDRPHGPDGGSDRRDRRGFRRPDRAPGSDAGGGPGGRPAGPAQGGPYRGVRERPARPSYDRPEVRDRHPYDSPHFTVTFYPEDTSFNTLVRTIRASCRTIELFEIARTVLDKPERFILHIARRLPAGAAPAEGAPPAAAPQEAPNEGLYLSIPDGLPFDTEEAAIAHVLARHLGLFFDTAEVEVDPPKGNYQVVNRCTLTGELLAPPNYHRYSQILQQHHAAKVGRMSLEAYRTRVETVRDPEVVKQWLDKMRKVTRYTLKAEGEAGAQAPAFDSFEDAKAHLLAGARDRMVRRVAHARVHGRDADALPQGEIRRAAEGALERQRRFPLETANALRGRLRREHFTIFKKGAKGVSYVCAVKRRFRTHDQVFSESIGALIAHIEANPLVKAGELAARLTGAAEAVEGAAPDAELAAKVARVKNDLTWLVHEGYVTEFIDGSLYAAPPQAEARAKAADEDHEEPDLENFPEPVAAEPPPSPAEGEPGPADPADAPAEPPPAAPAPEGAGAAGPTASVEPSVADPAT